MKFKTKITIANIIITVIAAASIYYIALKTLSFTAETIHFITIAAFIAAIIAMTIQYLLTLRPFGTISAFYDRLEQHSLDDRFTMRAFYTALYFPFFFTAVSAIQWYLASFVFFILLYAYAHASMSSSLGATFAIASGATIAIILEYFVYQRMTEPVIRLIQKNLREVDIHVRKRLGIFTKVFVSVSLLVLIFLIFIKTTSSKFVGDIIRTNSIQAARVDMAAYVPEVRTLLAKRLTTEQTVLELDKFKLGKSGYFLIMDHSYKDVFKISDNYSDNLPLAMLAGRDIYNDPLVNITLIKMPVNNDLSLVGVYPWSDFHPILSDFSKSQEWLLLTIALTLAMIIMYTVIDVYLPIKTIGRVIERISHGNFAATTGLFVEDEAGIVANSVRRMIDDIRSVIKTIKAASSNISDISDKMMNAIDHAKEHIHILENETKNNTAIIVSMQGTLNQLTEYMDGLVNSINDTIINSDNLQESLNANKDIFAKIRESIDAVLRASDGLSSLMDKLPSRISSSTDNTSLNGYNRFKTVNFKNEETVSELKYLIEILSDTANKLLTELKLAEHYKQKTSESLTRSFNTISSLDENVGKIVDDLNKIDMVIDDTNLLAMNSSVISAQAGTSGKGFDVVSEEITKLANVTQTKLTEVRNLTDLLMKEKDSVINNIGEKKKFVTAADDKLHSFKEEMSGMTDQMAALKKMYDTIGKAVKQLSSEGYRLAADITSGNETQHIIRSKLDSIEKNLQEITRHSRDFKATIETIAGKWSGYTENLLPVLSELSTMSEPASRISGYMKIIKNKTLEIHGILESVSDISKHLDKHLDSLNIRADIERIAANISEEPERFRLQ